MYRCPYCEQPMHIDGIVDEFCSTKCREWFNQSKASTDSSFTHKSPCPKTDPPTAPRDLPEEHQMTARYGLPGGHQPPTASIEPLSQSEGSGVADAHGRVTTIREHGTVE